MSDKISVIVPSYNHGPFLRGCLESALAQTYTELEVIVVDDCSGDDSLKIARSIKDPRLRVVKNSENMGTYGSQEAGMELATGEWVAILNSDDLWQPSKLERQLAAVQKQGLSWCYTLGQMIDESGQPLRGEPHGDWPTEPAQDLLPNLLNVNRLLASSVLFRNGAVHFNPRLKFCGDWVAWLWLAEHGPAACVAEPLTFWRQHDRNSYRRSQALTLEEIFVRRAILDRRDKWFAKGRDEKAIAAGLSQSAMALSALYVLVGEMRLARTAARMATRLRPTSSHAHKRRLVASLPKKLAQRRLWPEEPPVPIEPGALGEHPEILHQE